MEGADFTLFATREEPVMIGKATAAKRPPAPSDWQGYSAVYFLPPFAFFAGAGAFLRGVTGRAPYSSRL